MYATNTSGGTGGGNDRGKMPKEGQRSSDRGGAGRGGSRGGLGGEGFSRGSGSSNTWDRQSGGGITGAAIPLTVQFSGLSMGGRGEGATGRGTAGHGGAAVSRGPVIVDGNGLRQGRESSAAPSSGPVIVDGSGLGIGRKRNVAASSEPVIVDGSGVGQGKGKGRIVAALGEPVSVAQQHQPMPTQQSPVFPHSVLSAPASDAPQESGDLRVTPVPTPRVRLPLRSVLSSQATYPSVALSDQQQAAQTGLSIQPSTAVQLEDPRIVPLWQQVWDVPGVVSGTVGQTAASHWESVQGQNRIDRQLQELRRRMEERCQATVWDQEQKEFEDAWKQNKGYLRYIKRAINRFLSSARSALAEFESSSHSIEALQTKLDIDLTSKAVQDYQVRWALMMSKRRATQMEMLYRRKLGLVPVMEYPRTPSLVTWSKKDVPLDYGIRSRDDCLALESRRNILVHVLRMRNQHYQKAVQDACVRWQALEITPWARARLETLRREPNVVELLAKEPQWEVDPSGGLLINGCELDNMQSISTLTAFMAEYESLDHHGKWHRTVLKYAAGQWHSDDNTLPSLRGVRGVLRLMCTQLLNALPHVFKLDFVTPGENHFVDSVRRGNVRTLCLLFRQLLCEVASYTFNQVRIGGEIPADERHIVTAIIDGIDTLENDCHEAFYQLVGFFRSLCDEATWGDMWRVIGFKYILMHPRVSKLLEFPYPIEQPVFMEPCTIKHSMPQAT